MVENRSITYPAQTIKQVYNGQTKTGIVTPSGGTSGITYVNHAPLHLGKGDHGGPMILHRDAWAVSYGGCFAGLGKGSQVAIRASSPGTGPTQPLASTLYGFGGTAIARTTPTDPSVSVTNIVAQSVGRDAIPKALGATLWRAKMLDFRSLGKEYLNYQFGWKPFVDDIRAVMHAVINSHEAMKRLRDGSDRKTRVGYKFPNDTSTASAGPTFVYSVDSTITGWGAGTVVGTSTTSTDTWFKGCFTYHIPFPTNSYAKSEKYADYAKHVLGIRPTLEDMWDAAPWSWAVDWAVNVGDVAHNISTIGRDGLTLQYGYIMRHIKLEQSWSCPGGAKSSSCSTRRVAEYKVRFPASPYGFGLTYDGLTSTQKAILAAIGTSHFDVEHL